VSRSAPARDAKEGHASTTLLLQCVDSPYCTVIFEPYGSEYVLLPEDWLRVEVGGPVGGVVEVVHRPTSVLLWPGDGWDYISAVNREGQRPGGLF
jgi:hypothetical protein